MVLPESETEALASLERSLQNDTGGPSFLLLGSVTSEEMRRVLRALSIDHPLFILEANDAPNHLSLAREAKLVDRVITVPHTCDPLPCFRARAHWSSWREMQTILRSSRRCTSS